MTIPQYGGFALRGARKGQEHARTHPDWGQRPEVIAAYATISAAGAIQSDGMPEAARGAYCAGYLRAFVAWRERGEG